MITDKKADLIAGLLIGAAGLAVAAHTAANYPLGTLRRMGPGMFPMWLGIIIAIMGVALAIGAALKLRAQSDTPHPRLEFELRNAFLATASVIAFGALIKPAGLILAVIAVVAISAFADPKNRPKTVLVLITSLLVLTLLVFILLLGLPIQLLPRGLV